VIDGVVGSNEEQIATIVAGDKRIEAVSGYPVGQKVSVSIRPEDITIVPSRVSSSARNSFSGTITQMTLQGPFCRVEVDCGFRLVALITSRSAEELSLVPGKQVYASFKATAKWRTTSIAS
jgi:molybdopterin-binding protein